MTIKQLTVGHVLLTRSIATMVEVLKEMLNAEDQKEEWENRASI